jgi:hypothetical protein
VTLDNKQSGRIDFRADRREKTNQETLSPLEKKIQQKQRKENKTTKQNRTAQDQQTTDHETLKKKSEKMEKKDGNSINTSAEDQVGAYPPSILQSGHREHPPFDLRHLRIDTDVEGSQVGIIVEVRFRHLATPTNEA